MLDTSPPFSWLESEPGLKSGYLPKKALEVKSRSQIFLSSTFEDTKYEQDDMLVNVFPFMREEICRPLGLDFDVVTMRWVLYR